VARDVWPQRGQILRVTQARRWSWRKFEALGGTMRKMICSSIGVVCFLAVSIGALAQSGEAMKQDTMKQGSQMKHNDMKGVTLSGMVSDDGKMLMSDSDHKNWMISNPEAVKGHERHRVTVRASVGATMNEVHVTSVSMAKGKMKDSMKKAAHEEK
jgi:hypothetical protein